MKSTVKLEEGITSATRSRTYILPLVANQLVVDFRPELVNAYVYHKEYPEYKEHLFILMKFSADIVHLKKEKKIIEHKDCVFHKDLSKEYYMLCIKVSENILDDYNKIISSKYSKISNLSKQKILRYWNLNHDHAVSRVLRKDPELKKQLEEALGSKIPEDNELSSVMDLNKETYDPSWLVLSESPLPKMSRYK